MDITSSPSGSETYDIKLRWKSGVNDGFLAIPNLLLKRQRELKLTASELVTLLNVLSHWWTPQALPYPNAAGIAKRMGATQRTVERNLKSLIEKGLLTRVVQEERRCYDPAKLVATLERMASTVQYKRGDGSPLDEDSAGNPAAD